MKKIAILTTILVSLFMTVFSGQVSAATLGTIDITTTKQVVHPGESVTVDIEFGTELGAYTFNIDYDNNLFEYVSTEGGTGNDNGTKVIVVFHDETGGSNPRSNMSVTFRAKSDIITSNPTDFSITAEGLANADVSVTYDDITTPIVKDIVVEPEYVDYDISLTYTGDIIKNEEKDMKLTISSSMGKNYEHTRILAEVTTPSGANAKLLATDEQNLEHDIIQSGWGDAQGDPIGGQDVVKELAVRGLFSEAGNYEITFKLIDRDNSDAVIASKKVNIVVKEKAEISVPSEDQTQTQNPSEETTTEKITEESGLPKTGNMVYVYTVPVILALSIAFAYLRKRH